jgi:hypothetical protein
MDWMLLRAIVGIIKGIRRETNSLSKYGEVAESFGHPKSAGQLFPPPPSHSRHSGEEGSFYDTPEVSPFFLFLAILQSINTLINLGIFIH